MKKIVFVCEHGAAKSIIAAAHFNKLATEQDLAVQAIARATNPDEVLSPKTVVGLKQDGLTPTEPIPQKLSLAEAASAHHIVAFCELPGEYQTAAPIERWDDVPPVSEDYEAARNAILLRLNTLLKIVRA